MKAKYLLVSTFILLFIYNCKKSNDNSPPPSNNSVAITLVSDNNPSGNIGDFLQDSIVVKVTNQSGPISGYTVQFIGSGCNEDIPVDVTTKTDGTAVYKWALAADVGVETLRAVAINGKTRLDSISINANADKFSDFRSSCTPPYLTNSIVKLSTGRFLSSFNGTTSIRYSDDEGASWHPLTSFGSTHYVVRLATSPSDEILAATLGEGLFYSKDGGNTWVNFSPPSFNKQNNISGLTFTNSGNILFCGNGLDFYISTDKGMTWTAAQSGLQSNNGYMYPVQLNNGDLYIASLAGTLSKSIDGGKTWSFVVNDPKTIVFGIAIDASGVFYKSFVNLAATSPSTTIVVSNDNGTSFKNFYSFSQVPDIDDLEIINGTVYFEELAGDVDGITAPNIVTTFGTNSLPFVSYSFTGGMRAVYAKSDGIHY